MVRTPNYFISENLHLGLVKYARTFFKKRHVHTSSLLRQWPRTTPLGLITRFDVGLGVDNEFGESLSPSDTAVDDMTRNITEV